MKKRLLLVSAMLLCAVVALAAGGLSRIREFLTGWEEVPAISTSASGELRARLNNDGTSVSYELTYENLQGSVQQAHIHLGQQGVNGGISVWLCSNLASPPTPAGVQPCPASPATITGTFDASDVVGPSAQGIAAGEFAELVRAIRERRTYVNVHSTLFPGGEIRSQIHAGGGHDDDD